MAFRLSPDGPDQLRGDFFARRVRKPSRHHLQPGHGSEPRAKFERLAKLDGRRVYVFAFRVPQSIGYLLRESKRTIQVPFQGFVYADYETRRRWVRIDMKCTDIPRNSEYMNAALTLDYKTGERGRQVSSSFRRTISCIFKWSRVW